MNNPRTVAAGSDRLLSPFAGLVLSVLLSLVAFWLPLLSLVAERV